MYHVRVYPLAERVLSHIRRQELLRAGDRVGVAVSGGIDSVALLRLLLELRSELGIVLSIIHFNHKLRGAESDADQEFVASLAREYDVEFHTDSDDVAAQAAEERIGVEAAAREMRSGFFRYLLGEDREFAPQGLKSNPADSPVRGPEGPLFHQSLDKVATGHTLDDQAETVLMRIIRGVGLRGLRAIVPRIPVEDEGEGVSGEIIRPLLAIRRRELERYLQDLNQPWREDCTNASTKFTRNRLRHLVLPLLEREFNPAIAENLAELAEIARGEEDFWENEAAGWRGTTVQWSRPAWSQVFDSSPDSSLVQIQSHNPEALRRDDEADAVLMDASVSRAWLLTEQLAVQRRVVKALGEHAGIPLEFQHVDAILRFAADNGPSGKELSLPLGWKVRREPEAVVFLAPDPRSHERIPQDYEYELSLPGTVAVPEVGTVIEAMRITTELPSERYNPQDLLDAEQLHGPLKVRNWRPGDRFWPAHTKSPKKIKELLQERHVAQPERKSWPVITNGEEIVWVRGFPVPANLQAKSGCQAILIREMPQSSVDENLES